MFKTGCISYHPARFMGDTMSMLMRKLLILITVIASFLLGACSSDPVVNRLPWVYRIEIQQGTQTSLVRVTFAKDSSTQALGTFVFRGNTYPVRLEKADANAEKVAPLSHHAEQTPGSLRLYLATRRLRI